jgi:hypothetical protein
MESKRFAPRWHGVFGATGAPCRKPRQGKPGRPPTRIRVRFDHRHNVLGNPTAEVVRRSDFGTQCRNVRADPGKCGYIPAAVLGTPAPSLRSKSLQTRGFLVRSQVSRGILCKQEVAGSIPAGST